MNRSMSFAKKRGELLTSANEYYYLCNDDGQLDCKRKDNFFLFAIEKVEVDRECHSLGI